MDGFAFYEGKIRHYCRFLAVCATHLIQKY